METILVIASERREFDGVVRRAGAVRALEWGLDYAAEVTMAGTKWRLAADGPGKARARSAMARGMQDGCSAAVSFGFCGALAAGVDGVVEVSQVTDGEGSRYAARGAGRAVCFCSDRVVVSAAEKAALRELWEADVVDMESAAVAEGARAAGVPFYCWKAVTDGAGEGFPLDFNRYRDSNGRFRRGAIAAAALRRPWSRVPELLRLSRRCNAAAEQLGEYLADYRF